MSQSATLRFRAETLAAHLPALLADAEHLASTVLLGSHGRRRSGTGDEFWQYRPAMPGDALRRIDWRRSARSDVQFVQEKEWQAAQSVLFWVDRGQSMNFSSEKDVPKKLDRARVLALALCSLLVRGGERVALAGEQMPLAPGEGQLIRIAQKLCDNPKSEEYASPDLGRLTPRSRAVFVSDFLGDLDAVRQQMTMAADRGIRGILLQVLDPQEEVFPFQGRTIFQSVGQSINHETLKASDLRARYLERLATRKQELAELAALTGWQYRVHHSDQSAQSALLWLYSAIERGH